MSHVNADDKLDFMVLKAITSILLTKEETWSTLLGFCSVVQHQLNSNFSESDRNMYTFVLEDISTQLHVVLKS